MNPAILALLIQYVGLPELMAWLQSRHAAGQTVTDADAIQKLFSDTTFGEQVFTAYLSSHPATPSPPA